MTLFSRNGADISRTFPEVTAALEDAIERRGSVVLDGEIVALDPQGRPCFRCLQRRWPQIRRPSRGLLQKVPVRFYVFDILAFDGEDVRGLAYRQRRALLDGVGLGGATTRIQVPPFWVDVAAEVMLDISREHGLEGSSPSGSTRPTLPVDHRTGSRRRCAAAPKSSSSAGCPGGGPNTPPPRHVYLTAPQLQRLAAEAGEYGSLILLLGVGGLRWGEAAAVRVADVDFLRRSVALHRNAVAVRGQMVVGPLKSGRNRTVVLPPFVIEALALTAAGKDRDDLLWPSSVGGYQHPPGVRSWLLAAVARCQQADPSFPRVTAHDLRHTAASLAISAGANVKVVQRMLGHASAAMTLDVYADLFPSNPETVAANVAKMWSQGAAADDDQVL